MFALWQWGLKSTERLPPRYRVSSEGRNLTVTPEKELRRNFKKLQVGHNCELEGKDKEVLVNLITV